MADRKIAESERMDVNSTTFGMQKLSRDSATAVAIPRGDAPMCSHAEETERLQSAKQALHSARDTLAAFFWSSCKPTLSKRLFEVSGSAKCSKKAAMALFPSVLKELMEDKRDSYQTLDQVLVNLKVHRAVDERNRGEGLCFVESGATLARRADARSKLELWTSSEASGDWPRPSLQDVVRACRCAAESARAFAISFDMLGSLNGLGEQFRRVDHIAIDTCMIYPRTWHQTDVASFVSEPHYFLRLLNPVKPPNAAAAVFVKVLAACDRLIDRLQLLPPAASLDRHARSMEARGGHTHWYPKHRQIWGQPLHTFNVFVDEVYNAECVRYGELRAEHHRDEVSKLLKIHESMVERVPERSVPSRDADLEIEFDLSTDPDSVEYALPPTSKSFFFYSDAMRPRYYKAKDTAMRLLGAQIGDSRAHIACGYLTDDVAKTYSIGVTFAIWRTQVIARLKESAHPPIAKEILHDVSRLLKILEAELGRDPESHYG